jgi:hypothetical protein
MDRGAEDCAVSSGSLPDVSATTGHSFFKIEEDMTPLGIFTATPLQPH